MMETCPVCGYCDRPRQLVKPITKTGFYGGLKAYQLNALNIAEYFSGERSFDFYALPYYQFREILKSRFLHDNPKPDKEHSILVKEWEAKRNSYFKHPETRMAYAFNFVARKGSAFSMIQERLMLRIATGGVDINDEFEPFSIETEVTRLKDELRDSGNLKNERNDMFIGLKHSQSAVNRLLILNTPGSDEYVPISSCSVSDYFPELVKQETEEVRKDHE